MGRIKDKLRMAEWSLVAAILLLVIFFAAPQQLPVVLYKVALVTLFAHLGYLVDRSVAPYGRPDESLQSPDYRADSLRRAIIVGAVILAGAMAL